MDCRACFRLNDVDPALGGACNDVIAKCCKYGDACRMLCILRSLFGGDGGVNFLTVCRLRTQGCGGENSLDWFRGGYVDENGLVFE